MAKHMIPNAGQVRLTVIISHLYTQSRGGGHIISHKATQELYLRTE